MFSFARFFTTRFPLPRLRSLSGNNKYGDNNHRTKFKFHQATVFPIASFSVSWFWDNDKKRKEREYAQVKKDFETAALAQFNTAAHNPLPCDYTGIVFEPNFKFPQTLTQLDPEKHLWLKWNFKTHPEEYMQAVLDYCFDNNIYAGDIERCFSNNPNFYHMPFQHLTGVGREPIHGCTQERASPAGWLSKTAKRKTQTVAVGFYNDIGAYLLGRIFEKPGFPEFCGPDGKGILFPEGTVSFKLLFTQATVKEVPYLQGSPTWKVMLQSYLPSASDLDPPREIGDVRLMQVDLAIKDSRFNNPTDWVFASYTYDASVKNQTNPWRRLIPIGLQYGNDPKRMLEDAEKPLEEGYLNPVAKDRIVCLPERPWVGLFHRLVGPLDTFASSCLACHALASYPSVGSLVVKPPLPGRNLGNREQDYFFRNIKAGEVADENIDFYKPTAPAQHVFSLDYSLQLQAALNNFFVWRASSGFAGVIDEHLEQYKVPGSKFHPHKKALAKSSAGEIPAGHTHSG